MATLGLKEMGKFLWEGKEKKSAWLAVSETAIAQGSHSFWKMKRKT